MSDPAFFISGDCPDCEAPLVVRYARRDDQPFIGCSDYPQCRFTARYDTALAEAMDDWKADESWASQQLYDVKAQLREACRERDFYKAAFERQAQEPAALAPRTLRRELKKVVTVCHPDRWCQGQPAIDLAHQVTAALNRLREQLEVT